MFFFLIIFVGGFIFILFNVHYFVLLLSLEIMLLGVLYMLASIFLVGFDLVGVFFFLLLVAVIGGYSISLLVFLFRSVGKDFWFGFNFL